MTDRGDSHLFLINPLGWYTCLNQRRSTMHLVKLLERRFPKHKGNITAILLVLSFSLLLLGLGLMFLL